jgi:outer membrane protein assembly factor BamB
MRRMRTAAAGIAAMALLAACTADEAPQAAPTAMTDHAPGTTPQPTSQPTPALDVDEPEPPRAEDGRRIEVHEWTLDAIDPGGRHLHVSTFYGGEASDCNRYAGAGVTETAEAITIRTWLSVATGAMDCTDDGIVRSEVVELAEPLGDRGLRGCMTSDCRDISRGEPAWYNQAAGVSDGTAAVATFEQVVALDAPDGTLRWREPLGDQTSIAAVDAVADLVLVQDQHGSLRALDAADGTQRWHTASQLVYGTELGLGDGVLVVRRPDGSVALLDVATGETRWEERGPDDGMTAAALAGDRVVVLDQILADDDDLPSGTNRSHAAVTSITARSIGDGSPLWTRELPGRPHHVHVFGDVAMVRAYGGVYGLDLGDGRDRWAIIPFGPDPVRAFPLDDGLLVLPSDREQVRIDGATGEQSDWPGPRVGRDAALAAGMVLWTEADGTTRAVDVDTGAERWTTQVGAQAGPAAGDGDLVVLPTILGAVALDAATGAVRWSWVDPAPDMLRP